MFQKDDFGTPRRLLESDAIIDVGRMTRSEANIDTR